ncbi:AAA family ATPase [Enterococcus durans]|uniref:AAA family ATPase n=1 Tax=Enterococcus durans TaxID=53345 RepID=UPI002072ACE3|nr:AAA family ATPase [Enterococcus durans]MCM6856361.1 AAA family ATPase [Enterococcus durans]
MTKINILGDKMKINNLHITNVGNISDLNINFNSRVNVICGTNGIGKTTILNSIAACFSFTGNNLKKKYGAEFGKVDVELDSEFLNKNKLSLKINAIKPLDEYDAVVYEKEYYRDLIHFSIERSINYKELTSISKFPQRDYIKSLKITNNGLTDAQLKNWLVNRYMASGHWDDLEFYEQENFELMKKVFSIINPDIKFKKADAKNFEILLNDRGNEVYFEFESAGYKAIVFILLGIISEIEFRMLDNKKTAKEFSGVILIDEVDMHLHPAWQREIVRALKETFPYAQFIITTHSPSVLQDLDSEEIIPLEIDEENNVKIKKLNLSKYGLKGWTLEEILSDVMGVEYTYSNLYNQTMREFESALDNLNSEDVKKAYDKLDKMLHPQNPLRQILSIQMVGLEDD